MKNKTMIWWIILGALVVFFLVPKTGFLGSLLTICDNNEPVTIEEFNDSTPTSSTTFLITNGTISFPTNIQGNLKIVNLGIESTCSDIIDRINGSMGAYGLHEYKIANGEIYWCNKENTLLLYTSDPNEVAAYYAAYEVCRTQEYLGTAYEADPSVCEDHFGNWTGSQCICPDGSRLKINDECELIPAREETYTPPKVTTPPAAPTPEDPDRTTVYALGGLAIIAIAYFVYSTFFNKKKRGRR